MGIFDDGRCDHCEGGQTTYPQYHYDKQTKKDIWTEVVGECNHCKGTTVELTSMGKELVDFLRDIKGRI